MLRSLLVIFLLAIASAPADELGPVRVLFLGHEAEKHRSDLYYPMIAQALGREAIYFDYATTPEEAFADADHLAKYDAVLIYANHKTIQPELWQNLKEFVESGGGFVPVHCASWCFQNEPEYDQLVGGRFQKHGKGIFSPKTVLPEHPAIADTPAFEAWDETYFHINHNEENRTVLQVREGPDGDPQPGPEPWTWIRTQGEGRVFYSASGHDERVWSLPEFHELLKSGILWSIGDKRLKSYQQFLEDRTPLTYEKRDGIPNYEQRPEPLKYQFPLSAEDSMDYTRVPAGWKLELFAAEPDIINPIYLAWDERGRLWVAETTDYPNEVRSEGGNDKIKILEDTDGDGRCDKVTVFADGLNIPTSLTFANGGLIVAQAPDFLFLQDTDGDDIADRKSILFSGWGTDDTHAGPSNLRRGFDNWIWGAVGFAGFKHDEQEFKMGTYRFRKDGSEIEFIGQFNNNTWGLGFNASGDVFGSTANRNPAFFCGIPQSLYREDKRMSAKMIADSMTFYPITPNIRQVDAFGGYTSGAGYALATSENFPPEWQNRSAFIGGPTGHLLGRFQQTPNGAGYSATNERSIVASADEWFSPVAAEVGPDGNLWIADWYNFIIQHNPTPTLDRGGYEAVTGPGKAHKNANRDKQHGRIYRLVWDGAKPSRINSLATASDEELVGALGDPNLFWRQTAQRLLVDDERRDAAEALRASVTDGGAAAIHALWSLEGLAELDQPTHQRGLLSQNPDLRKNAIRALSIDAASRQLFFDSGVIADPDPQVRLAAFNKLAAFPPSDTIKRIARQLIDQPENRDDEWLNLALIASGGGISIDSYEFGPNLLSNASFENLDEGQPKHWKPHIYAGEPTFRVTGQAHSGKRSLWINAKEGADASWHTTVDLEADTQYRLAGWIKTGALLGAQGALLNVHGLPPARTNSLQRGNDWTEVEKIFTSDKAGKFPVNLLFGGWGSARGTAWYDDVSLQKMTPIYSDKPQQLTGDSERGKDIFMTHSVAACIRCHVIDGEGGPIGPALDGLATRKDAAYIRESLVDPQATIAEGWQLEASPMPPMGVLLKPRELEDVMSYLMTLE